MRVANENEGHLIALGGGSPEAVYAFQQAAGEVGSGFDHVVVPCSSGSTYVGIAMAYQGTPTQVVGVSADPEPDMVEDLMELSFQASREGYGAALACVDFRTDYVGEGYGVPCPQGEEARRWLAECEGIVLDPVYTGKAFAGLLDMVEKGELGGRVLFWHTGGLPVACAAING
jgi:1-aminocyclopropane-1-carboxylate deaminase/D-cysteine desulfhydrase-like pyridoxal-dependent ACC family enzyme